MKGERSEVVLQEGEDQRLVMLVGLGAADAVALLGVHLSHQHGGTVNTDQNKNISKRPKPLKSLLKCFIFSHINGGDSQVKTADDFDA